MVTKILWLSRHDPTPVQIEQLRQAFGDVEIVQEAVDIKEPSQVKELMERHEASEVMAVLPINLLSGLIRLGVKPIRAVMDRKVNENKEATFTHLHFERVEKIEVVTTRLV